MEEKLKKNYVFFGMQPVLPARDVAETIAYYINVLGFSFDFAYGDPPEHGRVYYGDPDDGSAIRIQFTEDLQGKTEVPTAGWITIHVESDIEDLFEEYKSRGAKIAAELETYPWGLKEFEVQDCNGHILRFAAEA